MMHGGVGADPILNLGWGWRFRVQGWGRQECQGRPTSTPRLSIEGVFDVAILAGRAQGGSQGAAQGYEILIIPAGSAPSLLSLLLLLSHSFSPSRVLAPFLVHPPNRQSQRLSLASGKRSNRQRAFPLDRKVVKSIMDERSGRLPPLHPLPPSPQPWSPVCRGESSSTSSGSPHACALASASRQTFLSLRHAVYSRTPHHIVASVAGVARCCEIPHSDRLRSAASY